MGPPRPVDGLAACATVGGMEAPSWRSRPARACALLAKAASVLARWRLQEGIDRHDLLQESWLRWWHDHATAPVASLEIALPGLLGVARNVVREWGRRAVAERQRLMLSISLAERASVRPDPLREAEFRAAFASWLSRQRLPATELELVLAVRWDGLSWDEAFDTLGVADRQLRVALQRKILRFLSDHRVRKSFTCWLAELGLPSPLLPLVQVSRRPKITRPRRSQATRCRNGCDSSPVSGRNILHVSWCAGRIGLRAVCRNVQNDSGGNRGARRCPLQIHLSRNMPGRRRLLWCRFLSRRRFTSAVWLQRAGPLGVRVRCHSAMARRVCWTSGDRLHEIELRNGLREDPDRRLPSRNSCV